MSRRLIHEPTDENYMTHRQGRHRRLARGLGVWRPRPGRFSTVWLCTQDEPAAGTGVLAGWLLDALVKVVTTYSVPGDRVLLLAPGPASAGRRSGSCGGLLEAVWPVVRLGRGVQTGLMAAGAGSRPVAQDAGGLDGLFDVVLAAVEPRVLGSVRPTGWGHVLAPRGVFAVITHGARTGSRFSDPAVSLVRAAYGDGLRYLDRITLLQLPASEVSEEVHPKAAEVRVRAHADLHVFCHRDVPTGSLHEFGDLW